MTLDGSEELTPRSRRSSRGRRSVSRASCRSAASSTAPAGRSRSPSASTASSPGSRCTPTRRRGSPPPVGSRRPGPRSSGCATRAASGRWGRPGSTTSAPARRGGRPRSSRSGCTSTWPSGSARPWSSTTGTRTPTCCGSWTTRAPPERVVMHCFSGDADFARACLDRGFWLSFAGTVTFKNAADLREALLVVPPDRLLVETDAPFLTPVPHRGRPNASYLVPHTVRAWPTIAGEGPGGAVRRGRGQHLRGVRRAVGTDPIGRRSCRSSDFWPTSTS